MDSYLERLDREIASAMQGMSSQQLTHHLAEKWSAAEILEHLYLTYAGTRRGFDRSLEEGKPQAGVPTFRQKMSIALVVGLGYMPEGRKSPAPVIPRGMPAEKVVAGIGPEIAAMDKAIAQCEARYGPRTRLMDHPILGPMTARQWRKFHWVHGRHHLKQILKLKSALPPQAARS